MTCVYGSIFIGTEHVKFGSVVEENSRLKTCLLCDWLPVVG